MKLAESWSLWGQARHHRNQRTIGHYSSRSGCDNVDALWPKTIPDLHCEGITAAKIVLILKGESLRVGDVQSACEGMARSLAEADFGD